MNIKPRRLSEEMRFTLPVIAENAFTAGVSLVYAAVTGAISQGALAASNVANQAMNLIFSMLAMLSTGSAILVARYTGRGDRIAASRSAEATVTLGLVLGAGLTVILLLSSSFIMKLLMPGANSEFLGEGTLYFRMILLSVPPVVLSNSAASMLRAAGASRTVLVSNIISNAVQLACVWLFTTVLNMDIRGAALATVICRYVCAVYLGFALVRNHRGFGVEPRHLTKPDFKEIKHIFSVGFPASVDALSVQAGYVIINSMLVSIGQAQASVVGVLNSVLLFTGVSQGIGSCISTTLVGHRVGAGDIEGARRTGRRILFACEAASLALCVPAVIFSTFSASVFSKSPDIVRAAADFMWIMFPYCFVAVGVNVCEPVARVGGEVKFTMTVIVLCVWLIRLPLTYLLAIVLKLEVKGIYAANIISLGTRFALSYARGASSRWGRKEL